MWVHLVLEIRQYCVIEPKGSFKKACGEVRQRRQGISALKPYLYIPAIWLRESPSDKDIPGPIAADSLHSCPHLARLTRVYHTLEVQQVRQWWQTHDEPHASVAMETISSCGRQHLDLFMHRPSDHDISFFLLPAAA